MSEPIKIYCLPYTGEGEFNILHSWGSLYCWCRNKYPQIGWRISTEIFCRLKKSLIDDMPEIEIDDIPIEPEQAQQIIDDAMKVINKHPYILAYWKR